MKKRVTIVFDEEIFSYLQDEAKKNHKQVSAYLNELLSAIKTADITLSTKPTLVFNNKNMVDLSTLPDNATATIKTKTPPPPKTPEEIEAEQIESFQKLAKEIVGHEIDRVKDATLDPGDNYYDLAEEKPGFICRWPFTLPKDKQIEYLKEWKYYEDEGLLVY